MSRLSGNELGNCTRQQAKGYGLLPASAFPSMDTRAKVHADAASSDNPANSADLVVGASMLVPDLITGA